MFGKKHYVYDILREELVKWYNVSKELNEGKSPPIDEYHEKSRELVFELKRDIGPRLSSE